MRRRTAATAIVALLATFLGVSSSPATAHGGHNGQAAKVDKNKAKDVQVYTSSVIWTLTDSQCSYLPTGTVVTGTGTLVDEVTTKLNRDGSVSITYDDLATGTATDQVGNVYQWRYDNLLRHANSVASPNVFRGRMIDSFRLSGDGPIRLNNGFVANTVDDRTAGTFTLDPVSSRGDPFTFPSGPGRCDPL